MRDVVFFLQVSSLLINWLIMSERWTFDAAFPSGRGKERYLLVRFPRLPLTEEASNSLGGFGGATIVIGRGKSLSVRTPRYIVAGEDG